MALRDPWPHRDTSGLPAWDERILALLPHGVDESQLVENLRLSPTERVEKLQALLDAVAAIRGQR